MSFFQWFNFCYQDRWWKWLLRNATNITSSCLFFYGTLTSLTMWQLIRLFWTIFWEVVMMKLFAYDMWYLSIFSSLQLKNIFRISPIILISSVTSFVQSNTSKWCALEPKRLCVPQYHGLQHLENQSWPKFLSLLQGLFPLSLYWQFLDVAFMKTKPWSRLMFIKKFKK